ncbi:MAG: type II toxin-antitoxin system RelE/ParE family toxin [Tepidisphaeraceae bacterium]|jgi:mRNA interferase RelE/StbE
MYEIRSAEKARENFKSLPLRIQVRVQDVFDRLTRWPNVSGVKPLRGPLKGAYRIRTGDWRVLFTVDVPAGRVTVFRIDNRRDVYQD